MSSATYRSSRRSETILFAAIGISIGLHAIALAVHFTFPTAFDLKVPDNALEVVLVNGRSKSVPVKPRALAQADLNGGGEHDEGRVTSFLPNSGVATDGDVVKEADTAVSRLEAEQRKLMSQLRDAPIAVDPNLLAKPDPNHPIADVADNSSVAQQIKRLEAEIDKQINDYNARPRRGFIGPNTRSVTYAHYYTAWKDRVERIGTENFPAEARGKLYGDLILTVTLNPDGTIFNDEVTITKTSGYPVLDRAAKRIIKMAAPYGHFPADMRREYDVFEIVTRFTFTRGDGIEAHIERK